MSSLELAWRIRRYGVEMTNSSKASHIAAILSVADIIAVLYNDVMQIDPHNPKNDRRDRFILSKGHAGAAVYAALAEKGFFSVNLLKTYYQDGSQLSGHISHKNVNGVEASTGSLGHGICIAAGMAMAAKHDKKAHRIYTLIGDGECDEGSVWEAALFANHNELSNLTVIVDHNKMQGLGFCKKILDLTDLAAKWKAFGWACQETDGHDHELLRKAILDADAERPNCIIAHTIKGKGVSFMENNILWHYRNPSGDTYERAVQELEAAKP